MRSPIHPTPLHFAFQRQPEALRLLLRCEERESVVKKWIMSRRFRSVLLLLAPTLGIAAPELSPACRQAAAALNGDFLNVKEQSSITLSLTADDSAARASISFGPATPAPLVALGQYVEGSNSGITALLKRPARTSAAVNTLVNHKSSDPAVQAAYTSCSQELGLADFFDLVARNSDVPDWAPIAAGVHRLFSGNRATLTEFLYRWDKHEPVAAMFFLLSAFQNDPPMINTLRAAYNADAKRLAQLVRAEVDITCKWGDVISVAQAEQEQNRDRFQAFLKRLDQGNRQDAYHFLFTQLLGNDQPSKDNFTACRQVDSPRLDCIAHKVFNREKDFDKCANR